MNNNKAVRKVAMFLQVRVIQTLENKFTINYTLPRILRTC